MSRGELRVGDGEPRNGAKGPPQSPSPLDLFPPSSSTTYPPKPRSPTRPARDTREVEAEQALDAEQTAQQEQAEYNEVSRGFDVPTIIQNIRVRKSLEGTVTAFNLSNKEVRACLQSQEYKSPFKSVFRRIIFENGIPEEYWWDEESERRAGTPNSRVTQTLTRGTWLKMADQEKQNADGHAVSGYGFLYDEEN